MPTGAAQTDDGLTPWDEATSGPTGVTESTGVAGARAGSAVAGAPPRHRPSSAAPHLVAVAAPEVPDVPDDDSPADDPADIAGALARCVAEVLSGARELDTIARWITDEVHRHLLQRVALAARARSAARRSVGRPVFHVGGVVLDRSRGDVVEASVVVHTRTRARAVSIRLEVHAGRWRATSIAVL